MTKNQQLEYVQKINKKKLLKIDQKDDIINQ